MDAITVLWPDFMKTYGADIAAHLRTKTFGPINRWEVKTAYFKGDDTVTIFFREKIVGYAKIDYSEPCLIFIPK